MRILAKFALLILVVAIIILLLTGNMLSRSPLVIAGQLLAVALSVWARRNFRANQFSIQPEPKDGPLISSGPYRYIRHPMYAAALLLIWSSVLGHWSTLTAVIGLIVTLVIAIRIAVEEDHLRASHTDYAEYARKTRRVIPFLI